MDLYKEIDFEAGATLEECINELNREKSLCFGKFNGIKLYSDKDDIDSAYLKVTGHTKEEYEKLRMQNAKENESILKEYDENLDFFIKYWREKGKTFLESNKLELWNKIVPEHLKSGYKDFNLKCCLEIVDLLNTHDDLESIKEEFQKQGHSGITYTIVSNMIREFSPRGEEFYKYL